MSVALSKLAQEDPSFRVKTDEETGQTIISGMGELHLDIIVDRMRREFSVEANIGKPQVAYRERIRNTAEIEGKFIRQSGGRGQYGHVWVRFEPAKTRVLKDSSSSTKSSVARCHGIYSCDQQGNRRADAKRCACGLPIARFKSNAV